MSRFFFHQIVTKNLILGLQFSFYVDLNFEKLQLPCVCISLKIEVFLESEYGMFIDTEK